MKRIGAAILAVILADQLVKWLMLEVVGIATRPPIEVTSFFRMVMVWNKGISFGMFNEDAGVMPWVFIAIAAGISVWLLRLAVKSPSAAERMSYALIIGGALGNVIDRLRFGAVADFFYFHIGNLGWPAFNIADAAICIGVALLLFLMVRQPAKP